MDTIEYHIKARFLPAVAGASHSRNVVCQHWRKREPNSSFFREPGFEALIGEDAVGALYQTL